MTTPLNWLETFETLDGSFSTNNTGTRDAKVTVLQNGNVLVTYISNFGGFTPALYGQLFASDGTPIINEFLLHNHMIELNVEGRYDVVAIEGSEAANTIGGAFNSDGGSFAIAVAGAVITAGTVHYIDYQVFNTDLIPDLHVIPYVPSGPVFQAIAQSRAVLSNTSGDISNISLTANHADRQVMITYTDSPESGVGNIDVMGVSFGTFDYYNGVNPPPPPFVILAGKDDADRTDATILANGNYVVAYEEVDNGVFGIEFQIIQADGTQVLGPIELSSGNNINPVVTSLVNGNFVIAWTDADSGNGEIRYSVIKPDGTGATTTFTAASGNSAQHDPQIVALPNGNFVISWLDDDPAIGIVAQYFSFDGSAIGSLFTIDTADPGIAHMSVTPDGRIAFTWPNTGTALPNPGNLYNGDDNVHVSIWDPRADGNVDTNDFNWNPTNFLSADTYFGGAENTVIDASTDLNSYRGIHGLYGDDGDDTLSGSRGADLIRGGSGDDIINGGPTNINLGFTEDNDLLDGGVGGETNGDTVSYITAFSAVAVNLGLLEQQETGGGGFDYVRNFENLIGSNFDDTLTGSAVANTLTGGVGSDTLYGEGGNDILYGAGGVDFVYGGIGGDVLVLGDGDDYGYGGTGFDWIYGGDGNDILYGGEGATDVLLGDAGNDTLYGEGGFDYLYGYADNDTIYGGSGVDVAYGGTGIDTIYGEADTDWLFGGAGNDFLYGGANPDLLIGEAGADIINAGTGNDWMWGDAITGVGGGGADHFVFVDGDGVDVIYDFEDGIDLIDFSGSSATSIADVTVGQIAGGFTWIAYGSGDVLYLWGAGGQAVGDANITASDFIF